MKRQIVENFIDQRLKKINSLQELTILTKTINIETDLYFNEYRSNQISKKEFRNKWKSLQFLKQRIKIVLPVFIDSAIEQQQYELLPEKIKQII